MRLLIMYSLIWKNKYNRLVITIRQLLVKIIWLKTPKNKVLLSESKILVKLSTLLLGYQFKNNWDTSLLYQFLKVHWPFINKYMKMKKSKKF